MRRDPAKLGGVLKAMESNLPLAVSHKDITSGKFYMGWFLRAGGTVVKAIEIPIEIGSYGGKYADNYYCVGSGKT